MAQQTFRNAFNGFNREDVVHYIEYLNTQHAAEVSQLRSELEYLRSNTPQETPAAGDPEANALIEQQAARIRELFDECKSQAETIASLTARLNAAPEQPHQKSCAEEELEAYRRAERAERIARERAEQMYHQANAVLADATAKVDDAAALISQMADHVSGRLAEFQSAISDSKQALRDAAATMSAICPKDDME